MKIRKIHKRMLALGFVAFLSCMAGACGTKSDPIVTGRYYLPGTESADVQQEETEAEETEQTPGEQAQETIGTDLFMIVNNNMKSETLMLKQLASGKQYQYQYTLVTRFLDKYGNHTTASDFSTGRCVFVNSKDDNGKLLEAQIADTVWEYPGVTRYSVDEERNILQIADTRYSYDESLFVNSDGAQMSLSELSEMDTLRLVGVGKKLLSVSVTTGHGALQLSNTDLFEGSFIQVGEKIFSEITKDMKLEVPEGTYTVAVANKGYGDTTEVTVGRDETVELDLDTLKGEGPKTGKILFAVDVPGAAVFVDGESIDYSTPVSIPYGVHSLMVMADEYDTYSKKLYVNCEEATIVIALSGESGSLSADSADVSSGEGKSEKKDTAQSNVAKGKAGTKAGSLAGSKAGSHAGSNGASGDALTSGINANDIKESVTDTAIGAIVDSLTGNSDSGSSSSDYVSTLTELLKVLKDID